MPGRDREKHDPLRGRGSVRNVPGRFEVHRRERFDDGWGSLDEPVPPLRTTVTPEDSRTILAANDSPDVPFESSINPYKGCEHGCSYCFARPTHAFLDLSPGLDFESRIISKPRAPDLLERELRKPGYEVKPIALGTNTDPYQPAEKKLRITRRLLEVLRAYRHPFTIVTKSNLVLRDRDLLAEMARDGLTVVYLSVTTLDRSLARNMEPRAPTPQRRLEAIEALSRAGVPTGVLASPMIPALNDHEIDAILEACALAGATRAAYILLRLPHELKELFSEWLETRYPTKAEHVFSRLREMRGGQLYDSTYGSRMRGRGVQADVLHRRFELACRRLGLALREPKLDCSLFVRPPRPGDQAMLFH